MRASTIKRMEQEYHNVQIELKGDVSQRKFSLEYHTRSNSCILYMKGDSGLQALLGQGPYHLFDICIVLGIDNHTIVAQCPSFVRAIIGI